MYVCSLNILRIFQRSSIFISGFSKNAFISYTYMEQWQYTGRNIDVIVSYFIKKKNNSVGPWASFSSFIFCSLLYFTRYYN